MAKKALLTKKHTAINFHGGEGVILTTTAPKCKLFGKRGVILTTKTPIYKVLW